MRKFLMLILCAVTLAAMPAAAAGQGVLRIAGQVRQPLMLTLDQLAVLDQIRVKHNEVTSKGEFHGVFWLTGVPLRNLLEMAGVEKQAGGFNKLIDLAIVVRDRKGAAVTLSWGEVFHRNPGDTVLALTAAPVIPKKSCKACHEPAVFEPWMKQLARPVGLPKLAVTRDFYSDRSLEEVSSVEVVRLAAGGWGPKMDKPYSPSFTVEGPGGQAATFDKVPDLPRRQVHALQFGEGKGFHGSWRFAGTSLADLLAKLKLAGNLNTVYVVSSPDGYRSLASHGELFLGPAGGRVILADTENGKPLEVGGRFELVFPDDLWADRWVKAVGNVEVLSTAVKPRLYVIGMGCGDASLLTLEALDYLARVDDLVAPADIQKRFAPYLAGKSVLFDPLTFGKKPFNPEGAHKDKKARHMRREEQKRAVDMVRASLEKGRSVAVLDWGDPMVYGSWRWLGDFFDVNQITFVPGLSAFNAGSAALARDITCNGMVAISDPFTLLKKPELVKGLAAEGATLAVFMGMPKLDQILMAITAAYPAETPVKVVLRAGFGFGARVIDGSLGKLDQLTAQLDEKWLGVIFLGPCLDAKASTDKQ